MCARARVCVCVRERERERGGVLGGRGGGENECSYERKRETVSNLVFYAQSATRDRETEKEGGGGGRGNKLLVLLHYLLPSFRRSH